MNDVMLSPDRELDLLAQIAAGESVRTVSVLSLHEDVERSIDEIAMTELRSDSLRRLNQVIGKAYLAEAVQNVGLLRQRLENSRPLGGVLSEIFLGLRQAKSFGQETDGLHAEVKALITPAVKRMSAQLVEQFIAGAPAEDRQCTQLRLEGLALWDQEGRTV